MAYAELADVKARAGRLALAWNQDSSPGDAEIERFLDDTAAEIDARLASAGVPLPLTDTVATGALRGLNADGAAVLAIRGAFPSGEGPAAAVAILADCQKRWDAAMGPGGTMEKGTGVTIAYLMSLASSPGADDFWTSNPDYGMEGNEFVGENVLNPHLAPAVGKADRF